MRIAVILFTGLVFAQQIYSQETKKLTFRSLQQAGLINGNNAVSGFLQTVNGIGTKSWFAGAGVGLDFYRYRSVPLFIDVKKYIGIKNGNRVFAYADGGYNLPWLPNKEERFSWSGGATETKSSYRGGLYMDAGLGYAIGFKNGNDMLLGVGYSYKYFDEARTTKSTVTGVAGTTETIDTQRYEYNFRRLMIKIGWQF